MRNRLKWYQSFVHFVSPKHLYEVALVIEHMHVWICTLIFHWWKTLLAHWYWHFVRVRRRSSKSSDDSTPRLHFFLIFYFLEYRLQNYSALPLFLCQVNLLVYNNFSAATSDITKYTGVEIQIKAKKQLKPIR